MWWSIIFFFLVTQGLGYLIDIFIKDWNADFFEKFIIRTGVGLALIPIFGVVLNFFKLIDWKIYLLLVIIIYSINIYCNIDLYKNILSLNKLLNRFKHIQIKKKYFFYLLVLIMFTITAYMYIHGAFLNPYFEDGDPYVYALSAKYIALEKTYSATYHFTHFAEPYTQGFQILMGLLHQTNDSIYWTLKFFTSLIVSLSLLFFYFFARKFTKKDSIALYSTFALFAIPCWVSHFVFSLNFNMSLFPILLYALAAINEQNKWKYFTMLIYASILINHFNTAVSITMFLIIYYIIKVFVEENYNASVIWSLIGGFLISFIFYIPSYIRHKDVVLSGNELGGMEQFVLIFIKLLAHWYYIFLIIIFVVGLILVYLKREVFLGFFKKLSKYKNIKPKIFFIFLFFILLILIVPSQKFVNVKGSGTTDYTLRDFFIAKQGNLTNNPMGVGLILMSIFSMGILLILINYKKLFHKENFWISTTFTWTVASLLIILGSYFSITYIPFRMWTFFALFVALIFGFSLFNLLKLVPNHYLKYFIIILVVILVIPTSFSQKYWHNTAPWSEHQILVPESQQLYIWIRDGGLPKDSMVTNLCHKEILLFGYDMLSKPWLNPELDSESSDAYYLKALNDSLESNYQFLKRNGFDYVTIGASCIYKFKMDVDLVDNRIKEMINATSFQLVKNTPTEFLFKVK